MARADTIIVCSLPIAKNGLHSPTSIRWQGVKQTVRYVGLFSTLKSHLGLVLLSVIWSSGVSVLEGL